MFDKKVYQQISSIIEKALLYYPNKDSKKAFDLFSQVVNLIPHNAESEISKKSTEELKKLNIEECEFLYKCGQDIWFACWGLWVCSDLLNMGEKDFPPYMELIKQKSPNTYREIQQRIREYQQKIEIDNVSQKLKDEIIRIASEENLDTKTIDQLLKKFISLSESNNQWWELRDMAGMLLKTHVDRDFIWELYEQSLQISKKIGRECSGIYEKMAQLRKKENAFLDAVKLFLIAFSEFPNEKYKDQIRICLKKEGFKDLSNEIKEDLINTFNKEGIEHTLKKVESLKK